MRILLTGVTGQVGGELLPLLGALGDVVAPSRAELDLSNPKAVREYVAKTRPDWIINPAAYTAVDKAESEPEAAYALNEGAPHALGLEAARLGIPVVHISTDYVFDGSGTRPWIEDDTPAPLGVYGASKLAGERALAETGAAHLVFRTSWVYGSTGKNFLLTILRLAQQTAEMRIVDDQHGAPTWSRDLARTIVLVLQRVAALRAHGQSHADVVRMLPSLYHAAGTGETTWFGFAEEFIRLAALAQTNRAQTETKFAKLVPIATREYPTPARRPANSRLDCRRLQQVFGITLPRWQDATATVVNEVLTKPSA